MIACGPSAKVYRGHDLISEKTVRLKVLMDNHVSCPVEHSAIEMLAPALLGLRHANVSALLELNVHGDDVTLVTEFAAGVNLWSLLHQQRSLSAEDVRSLCEQLLLALAAGEAAGLCHGDVKPSNVIIADHPQGGYSLQLQDWGEAACRRHQPAETMTYRAPELLGGGIVSSACDLFSAGATMATLLLGHAPVHGGSLEQLRANWAAFDPMLLRCKRPDVAPQVHYLLARLLKFNASERPQTAVEALAFLNGHELEISGSRSTTPLPASFMVPAPTLTLTGDADQWEQGSGTTQTTYLPETRPAKRQGWFVTTVKTTLKVAALALIAGLGYAVWLDQHGGTAWTRHWRQVVAEKFEALSALARQAASSP
jgi:serine/threonine protein kinase